MDSFNDITLEEKLDADNRISVGAEVGSMLSYLATLSGRKLSYVSNDKRHLSLKTRCIVFNFDAKMPTQSRLSA